MNLYSPVLNKFGIKIFEKNMDGNIPTIPPLAAQRKFVIGLIIGTIVYKIITLKNRTTFLCAMTDLKYGYGQGDPILHLLTRKTISDFPHVTKTELLFLFPAWIITPKVPAPIVIFSPLTIRQKVVLATTISFEWYILFFLMHTQQVRVRMNFIGIKLAHNIKLATTKLKNFRLI
jgi:hypothetical protein